MCWGPWTPTEHFDNSRHKYYKINELMYNYIMFISLLYRYDISCWIVSCSYITIIFISNFFLLVMYFLIRRWATSSNQPKERKKMVNVCELAGSVWSKLINVHKKRRNKVHNLWIITTTASSLWTYISFILQDRPNMSGRSA